MPMAHDNINHASFVVPKTSIDNSSSGSITVMVRVILCLSVLNPFCFITVTRLRSNSYFPPAFFIQNMRMRKLHAQCRLQRQCIFLYVYCYITSYEEVLVLAILHCILLSSFLAYCNKHTSHFTRFL